MYITLIAIALFIIPALIIAVCYAVIILIIWTKSKMLAPAGKKPTRRFTASRGNGGECDGARIVALKAPRSE